MKFILAVYLSLFTSQFISQIIAYEDICKCAVVGDGAIHSFSNERKTLELLGKNSIPVGSNLKKAYLSFTLLKVQEGLQDNDWKNISIQFNNNIIQLNDYSPISDELIIISGDLQNSLSTLIGSYYSIDVTNLINTQNIIQYIYPSVNNENPPSNYAASVYFYLTVIYEHPSLSLTNILLSSKNKSVAPNDKFSFTGLINPININKKISLAVNASDICTVPDSSLVSINNQYAGALGDIEAIYCDGVHGNFAFFNDSLIAYENDIANTTFSGADGVANIQPYLLNSKELDIQFKYYSVGLNIGMAGWYTNPIHQLVLAYTTTCEEFTVTTPEPQSVCKNEPLQLNVTGGNKYEWLPQRGLSCYDCPNPVVSTDSSRFYTVRVWNNDSCSVVRPVHVSVHDFPKFNGLALTPTQCADSTGKIVAVKHPSVLGSVLWSINGGAFAAGTPSSKTYNNLPEGTYTITIKDDEGCTRDTTVEIGYTINTTADFNVNPNQGVAPLTVDITNNSTNYTHSAWYLQGVYEDSVLTQLTLDPSGLYTLELITWYKDPKCADTTQRTILVYDTLVVSVPNVFTPNGDGTNDFFGITTNQPATVLCTLFNRWGMEIYKNEVSSKTKGFIPLWDGENFDEGVYYYKISVQAEKMEAQEMSGFFHLEK